MAIRPIQLNRPSLSLTTLPLELAVNIFTYLDRQSLSRATLSCRNLKVIGESSHLWKLLCIRDFPTIFSSKERTPKPKDFAWKPYYRDLLNFLSVPFPGKRGNFTLEPGKDWSIADEGVPLIRQLSFINETKDSLLEKIKLLGYKNGSLAVHIIFPKESFQILETYLTPLDLDKSEFIRRNKDYFHFNTPRERLILFKILQEFNQFPEKELPLLEKLIRATNWKIVTPFTLEEAIKYE